MLFWLHMSTVCSGQIPGVIEFSFARKREQSGRPYIIMPWPPAAECNMIINNQTHKLSAARLTVCLYTDRLRQIKHGILWYRETSRDSNKDGYDRWIGLCYQTLQTTPVRIPHLVERLPQCCAAVSAGLKVTCRPVQNSRLLSYMIIL